MKKNMKMYIYDAVKYLNIWFFSWTEDNRMFIKNVDDLISKNEKAMSYYP